LENLRILRATAVSVNHEIANPLQALVFAVYSVENFEKGDPRMKKYLDIINSNIERIGGILHRLTNAVQAATTDCAAGEEMLDMNAIIKCKEK
jgi:phosphoglycerate-specific signal transduction histidine kinase